MSQVLENSLRNSGRGRLLTSPSPLFGAVQSRQGRGAATGWVLDQAFPAHRATPLVTLLDGHPHTLAFLATVNRVRAVHLGVSGFGQSGDLEGVDRHHGLDTDSVVAAALQVRH